MDGPDGKGGGRGLRDVAVRGAKERRRWDAPMAEHHHLPFRGMFGKSLRHVAVRGDAWLAPPGWQAGAFKAGARDAWIGWTRERQFSRPHLIANNARCAVLPAGRVPNLASRAPGVRYPAYLTKGRDDRAGFLSRAGARERKHSRRLCCSEHVPARGRKCPTVAAFGVARGPTLPCEGAAALSVSGTNVEIATYLIEMQ